MSEFDFRVGGSPGPDEQAAVIRAIEAMLRDERIGAQPSAWKLSARAYTLRVGALELRHRLPGRWKLASENVYGATRPIDLIGRGDAR